MVRVRFAPSPTGFLHVGGARTALFNYLFARRFKGVFVLRIEDTDIARSERVFEKNLMDSLRWLGIEWDEGPDVGGAYGPYRQSERLQIYKEYAEKLVSCDKAYRVYAYPEEIEGLREELLSKDLPPHYTREMFDRFATKDRIREYEEKGLQPVIYFSMPRKTIVHNDLIKGQVVFNEGAVGDFALLRSNGMPTYNFACVVDDMLMRITHVIRGDDHLPNTVKQLALYEAFGVEPPQIGHVSMILGPDGRKLSKRHGATSVEEFRARGYLPEAVVNYLVLLGWSPPDAQEIMSMEEMIEEFCIDRVSKNPAIFDPGKLKWMNGHYIRKSAVQRIVELLIPYIEARKWTYRDKSWLESVFLSVRDRMHTLEEFTDLADFLFVKPDVSVEVNEQIRQGLLECANKLEKSGEFSKEQLVNVFREVVKQSKLNAKDFYMALRRALTGKNEGPELVDIVVILGAIETAKRIKKALGVE